MENITIFDDIIRVNISFVILGTSPKEYYSMEILDKTCGSARSCETQSGFRRLL